MDVRAPMLVFFKDFEHPGRSFGRDIRANDPRMSAGYPSQKLPLWADFSFLKTESKTSKSGNFQAFLGSSQTWLFQTWLFVIFMWKRSFALCCALLHSFALFCAPAFALFCALLRAFACFCVRPRLERPRLGTAEF